MVILLSSVLNIDIILAIFLSFFFVFFCAPQETGTKIRVYGTKKDTREKVITAMTFYEQWNLIIWFANLAFFSVDMVPFFQAIKS